MKHKNNYLAKTIRTFTAVFPVDKNRKGQCIRCGRCCRLPNDCPFLIISEKDGNAHCKIYFIRPLNCRKYPRTKDECVTSEVCGFRFE